jgi:hypothetical protein
MAWNALELFERVDREQTADMYDLACARSLSSDLVMLSEPDHTAEERSRHLADRAMVALRQVVDGGFGDLAQIEKDTDWIRYDRVTTTRP